METLPIILTLGKLSHKDYKPKASLCYIVSSRSRSLPDSLRPYLQK